MKKILLVTLLCISHLAFANGDTAMQAFRQKFSDKPVWDKIVPQLRPTLIKGVFGVALRSDPERSAFFINDTATLWTVDKVPWRTVKRGLNEKESDLTTEQQAELGKEMLQNLDLDRAIKVVYGKGERKVILLSAYDCPACQAIEKRMAAEASQLNLTLYVFASTLDASNPQRLQTARALACNRDSKLWLGLMRGQSGLKAAPVSAECNYHPSLVWDLKDALTNAGIGRNTRGVPFFILEDGQTSNGPSSNETLATYFSPTKSKQLSSNFWINPVASNWLHAPESILGASAAPTNMSGTYQIGEGLSGSDDTTAAKPADPDALKKLKAKFKKIF